MKLNYIKIKKQIEKRQRLILVLGIVLTISGLLRYILAPPRIAIYAKSQLPTIVNGTELILLGVGMLVGWFLTLKNKDRLIKESMKDDEKLK